MGSVNLVGALTWDAVETRIASGAAAILPVGAGAKEHGLHLPMETDRIQAEFLAARLGERIDALIWPTVTYGYYPAFIAYGGSASLSHASFRDMMRELIDGIADFGAAPVFVLDTGVSTIAPVDEAILASRAPARAIHLKAYDGPRVRAAIAALCGQPHCLHADDAETSIMLAIAPELVDMARARTTAPDWPSGPSPLSRDPDSPGFSASGAWGDPRFSTAEKGETLIAAMLDDLSEAARVAGAEKAGRDGDLASP
jgi:creatinine amidohydrolase